MKEVVRFTFLVTGTTPVQTILEKTAVIDMGISEEGIINNLMQAIMAKERPEYESQRRAASKDIVYHQREIHKEQVLEFLTFLSNLKKV